MSQFAQAPRIAQIDFMQVQSNTNRFRAYLSARRFNLARAWLALFA